MTTAETIEPELIDSRELARICSVSVKFIEAHRHSIVGSMKLGGRWRYRLNDIRARLALGKDIVINSKR